MLDAETLPPVTDEESTGAEEAPFDAYSRVAGAFADRVGPAVVQADSRRGVGRCRHAWHAAVVRPGLPT